MQWKKTLVRFRPEGGTRTRGEATAIEEARMGFRRKQGIAIGLALATIALAAACTTPPAATSRYATPPTKTASLASAPAWLVSGCRAHWSDPARAERIVCGVGSAPAHRNRVAARETAIARGRAEIARSLEVTIESLVRLVDRGGDDGDLDTIVHQLSSTSMRGVQLEEVWRAESGETYALVSLDVARIEETVRDTPRLPPADRASLAARAAAAFAALDADAER
ncbi:MAG: hypothetical protein AAGC67_21635 [Myxococcota bacterium]